MSLPDNFDPLVSIVIPVFNGSNYLKEAVESALNQKYKNTEVIVINDGSEDGGKTEKIIDSYGDKIIPYHKKNGGVASALNYAIERMGGTYFSWLSHDDIYHTDKLGLQLETLVKHKNKNAVVYSNYVVFKDDPSKGVEIELPEVPSNKFRYFITTQGSLNGCTLLIPKVCFNNCGLFNEKLKNVQDYDMWFRIAQYYEFLHTPKAVVYSRQHNQQASRLSFNISQAEGNNLLKSFVDQLTTQEILEEGCDSISYGYANMSLKLKKRGYKSAAKRATLLSFKSFGRGNFKTDIKAIKKVLNVLLRP